MNIFVTGATGYIGHAVVAELAGAGHGVTGLVRSDEKAEQVRRLGARALVGDIAKPDTYRDQAAAHDGLVHTAFDSGPGAVAADRTAIETLITAARAGSARSLVYTSGIWVLGATGDTPAFEDAPTDHPAALVTWRVEHERLTIRLAIERLLGREGMGEVWLAEDTQLRRQVAVVHPTLHEVRLGVCQRRAKRP